MISKRAKSRLAFIPAMRIRLRISKSPEAKKAFLYGLFFYTIIENATEVLKDAPENRSTTDFNNIRYVVIDDPVSSMDDTRIITIALELAELIEQSNNQLRFLITTHHALFFNVLFNANRKNWDRKNYILSKSGADFLLKSQGNDSPFAYHHVVIAEIKKP